MAQIMAKPRARKKPNHRVRGQDPGGPGDGGALGQPLEEVAGHALAARDHPLRDVLVVKLVPVVLRRGVVRRAEEAGDDELGEAHAGDAAGHHQHDVDRDQLGPGQRQPPVQEAHGAAGQDEKEEEEERGGGAEVEGQVRPLDRVRRVGVADVEHQGQHGPDEEAPQRDPPRIPRRRSIALRRRRRHRGPDLRRLTRGFRARPAVQPPGPGGEAVELFTAARFGRRRKSSGVDQDTREGVLLRSGGAGIPYVPGTPPSALRTEINRDRSASGNAVLRRPGRAPRPAEGGHPGMGAVIHLSGQALGGVPGGASQPSGFGGHGWRRRLADGSPNRKPRRLRPVPADAATASFRLPRTWPWSTVFCRTVRGFLLWLFASARSPPSSHRETPGRIKGEER